MLARQIATLDHLSDGRAGWNIVTGSNDGTAQNYGQDKHYPHDERYDRADEFVEVVKQLIGSWEPDAIVMDRETGTFADHTKIHPIEFEGRFYRSRGPLNVAPAPQGRPVFCQAGGSPRGRDFAAGTADTIVASMENVSEMKEFRDDIRARMQRFGRNPDDCKVMFMIDPVLGETASIAAERAEIERAEVEANLTRAMANFARVTGIDYSSLDPDTPVAELSTNGHQSVFAKAAAQAGTVRELILTRARKGDALKLVGTPDAVASQMGEMAAEICGDGFLIGTRTVNRHALSEVTDGLVPELQRRGLTRTGYEFSTFRENLLAY
jgi:FMN-dependent oxidoreductase (nitrilotriacetate monooxygenase family)